MSEERNDELIERPAWIVYEEDIQRLREWARANGCGDSATAIRKLLDDATKEIPYADQPLEELTMEQILERAKAVEEVLLAAGNPSAWRACRNCGGIPNSMLLDLCRRLAEERTELKMENRRLGGSA